MISPSFPLGVMNREGGGGERWRERCYNQCILQVTMLDTEHGPVLDVCISVPANLSHIDTNMHGPRPG